MTFQSMLARLVQLSQRNALLVVLAGVLLGGLSAAIAVRHLGISTNTYLMFAENLPWRQSVIAFNRDFPQSSDLLVAVIDARIPEEAEATAAALAEALVTNHAHFTSVRRPDASPFFTREGFLFLDKKQLETLLDNTIDAQPFLGQLVADPSARGLFTTLSLIGTGIEHGPVNLEPFQPALTAFHRAMADTIAGQPQPLSWINLLGGRLAELGGGYKFVLVQPKLDFGALRPGGAAADVMRQEAEQLSFVKAGEARVRITGVVALADDEFGTVAQGVVTGLIGSALLITIWLFLAVRSWRLIVPILFTLGVGLMLTLLFAAAAVGTLNLVSVGFGILFVGIAVDFAIQFSVRLREVRNELPDLAASLAETGRRAGVQILVAAAATSAGFLSFVPTDFLGVAELGLIAGVGMIIAFLCTLTFLPAAIALFHPRGENAEVGFSWAGPLDAMVRRGRWPISAVFALLAALGAALLPRLTFDTDPLHTKDPTTEAMRTLYDLMDSPLTNPFTIDIVVPSAADAAALAEKLAQLPLVATVLSINSFVPDHQPAKLALIADAKEILTPTLEGREPTTPVTPEQMRVAAAEALQQIELARPELPEAHLLAAVVGDLRQLSKAPDPVLLEVDHALTRFLPVLLAQLRTALHAQPVTLQSIPPEISRDWLLPDGRARVQVLPKSEARNSAGLHRFVDQVVSVVPTAGGSAVTIEAISAIIIDAFRSAAMTALGSIGLILFVTLRRTLDVALVLAPLLLSALMTVVIAVLLPLPLNYANIIALPVLLGVGVSFNVYFVMNWRAGRTSVLGSATARAILFSALTTGTAFGSLALSAHPGTASMGGLLLISLGCTLFGSMVFVPALLAVVGSPNRS